MTGKAKEVLTHIGKEFIVPSLVAGPVIGLGVQAVTSKDKKEFKEGMGKAIGAGIAGDIATGAALGIWNQRKTLFKKADFAPGIPSRFSKELPRISEPQPMRLAIQEHKANKAGPHYDIRIVDDKTGKAYSWAAKNLPNNPGDKTLAILQPTHTAEYSTWSGKIESGYGAGTVELFSQDKIEVIKAEPGKITFNVYKTNGDTERYAMINTGGDDWLFHNVTPTRGTRPELPTEKPHYKSISPDTLDPTKLDEIWSPKVDGALNVFLLKPDKRIETYSYRPSAKGKNKLIDHTFRLNLHNTFVPTAFKGKTVILGEVFARDRATGKVLPSTDTAARLLSNVWRSRELQQKAPLDNMVFNVLRYNGRDVSGKPYEEKLKILKQITSAVPQLKMPPLYSTNDSKAQLMKDVKSGAHPLTQEGVVVYKLGQDTPIKAKLMQDYDVFVRGTFPGEGKYKGKAAGGFTYSFKPQGPVTGRVGSGLSDTMRKELWEQPEKYKGSVARIFAQQQLPSGALRMPVFKDIRSEKFAALSHGMRRGIERGLKNINAADWKAISTKAILGEGKIIRNLKNSLVEMELPHEDNTHRIIFDTIRKKIVTHLGQTSNTFELQDIARFGRLKKSGNKKKQPYYVYKFGGRSPEDVKATTDKMKKLFGPGFVFNEHYSSELTRPKVRELVKKHLTSEQISKVIADETHGLGRHNKFELALAQERGIPIEMRKIASYYHAGSMENLLKFMKEGIPKDTFIARRKISADFFGAMRRRWGWAKMRSPVGIIKIDIPKEHRSKYLKPDSVVLGYHKQRGNRRTILNDGEAYLEKRLHQAKEDIPPKFIRPGVMKVKDLYYIDSFGGDRKDKAIAEWPLRIMRGKTKLPDIPYPKTKEDMGRMRWMSSVKELRDYSKTIEKKASTYKMTPKEMLVQYMSRNDAGKRKFTWAAAHDDKSFELVKKHLEESGYMPESELYRMSKAEAIMKKLAYPAAAEPVTTYPISSTNLHEIGKTQGEEMPDTNVQARQENPIATRPSTVRIRESRKFLRKKADASSPQTTGGSEIYMTETPKTQNYYQDTSAYRITEHTPDAPSSTTVVGTPTIMKNKRKVKVWVR